MQYEEKQEQLAKGYGIRAPVNDGLPKGNTRSDFTAQEAVEIASIKADINLIEKTAQEASGDIYPWILKNVTKGYRMNGSMFLAGDDSFMNIGGIFSICWRKKGDTFIFLIMKSGW